MAEFLLIHGSCHGAWCWRDLIPELTALGHSAHAIDLPSHGSDPTPIADVTMENSRDAILAASTPESIVVAHSWGGYPASAAAEADPDAMRGLIYLCAYVPKPDTSMVEMRRQAPRQPILDAVIKSADGLSYMARPDKIKALFYHDCPKETVSYALPRLCPQAIRPQETPLTLTDRFAGVPKAYIRTLDDRCVPTEYQQEMSRIAPEGMRQEIFSAHSPFFSHPKDLAQVLNRIAEGI